MERKLLNWKATALFLLIALFCNACSDELESNVSSDFEEGLPATVSFTVCPADLSIKTRAGDVDDSYISDLYIAIFDSEGTSEGNRIFSQYYEDVSNNSAIVGNKITLKLTSTKAVKILAIANLCDENKQFIPYIENYFTTFRTMKQLNFWRTDETDVNHYNTTFIMSGWYTESKPNGTQNVNAISTVDIQPGDNDLGAIYLRRLTSYNKFRVKAGNDVSLKINTWQVCMIPTQSYMFEHSTNDFDLPSMYTESKTSHTFSTETDEEGNTVKTFDFYQLENKHTACTYSGDDSDWVGIRNGDNPTDLYTDREREYKNADGTNSGIYKSLISRHTEGNDDNENLANNYASYVILNADIDYYIADTDENRANPGGDQAVPVPYDASAKLIHRTANVNYTIHLGFCDGATAQEKAMDFNCFRNTKYTYNVTINGVKNVVVEAKSESGDEPEPGAEGTVYDAYADEINLDSHYCEFNIDLTDEEREALIYRITSPYNGYATVFYVNPDKGYDYNQDWESNELFTWIKFRPTTGEYVLAEYDEDELWSIEAMRHPNDYPGTEPTTAESDGSKWYTVFVDEYVYHKDDSAPGLEDSWPNYVNQDDRTVELIKNSDVSKDGASDYSFCKFVFAQKSIQTYYNSSSPTALGVEHTDETYCLNITWSGAQSGSHSATAYSFDDGAYNLWNFVTSSRIGKAWSGVIDATTPCTVLEDKNENAKVMTHHDAARYPVYQPAEIGTQTYDYLSSKGYPSPNDPRLYYANGICMNRNRDLDHDGTIDPEEVRWYNPTSNEYIQISIGQGELPDPLIQFGDHDPDELKNNTGTSERAGTYYYHHITSDYQYFWAEQSVNLGDSPFSRDLTQCYTARCVRHLGTQRTKDDATALLDKTTPISKTYVHDADAHTMTLDKYTAISLRGYTAGSLAPHNVASVTGRPYTKFEYATDVCRNISDEYVSVNSNGKLSYLDGATNNLGRTTDWYLSLRHNGICGKYTQETDQSDKGTWRVPNLKELAFLYMEGLVQTSSNDGGLLSSTYDFFTAYELKDNPSITKLFMGYNDLNKRQVLARDIVWSNDNANPTIKVRCVRDVQ